MDIWIFGSYHWWQSILERHMDTARLFQSGRSQAVRLPKEYRFIGTEVAVKHYGNGVLLLPINDPWQTMDAGLAAFEPGFVLTREQPDNQIRAEIAP
jgi:antitoxin VapB